MLAASLMEWYLQTRTNTSINYKTILQAVSLSPMPIPRALPYPYPLLPPSRQSIAQPASPPPLFLHVDDELLITRIPRVISRTIVPSPGLRKYLTLEGWEGKKRTRSSESDRAVDGNGNRGNKKTKMNTVVNRWRRQDRGLVGGSASSLETNFSEIDWKTNTGAKRSRLRSDDPLNY